MRYRILGAITAVDLSRLGGSPLYADAARFLRAPLLTAFDIYKSNVSYGVITETAAEHKAVAEWYRRLLDLDPTALTDVPSAVACYVRREVVR